MVNAGAPRHRILSHAKVLGVQLVTPSTVPSLNDEDKILSSNLRNRPFASPAAISVATGGGGWIVPPATGF